METTDLSPRVTPTGNGAPARVARKKFDPTQLFAQRDRLPWFWFFVAVAVTVVAALDRYHIINQFKQRERVGILGSLPPGLPDLLAAYRLQERAASVGFDWPDAEGPSAKVREELAEVEREIETQGPGQHGVAGDALTEEIGDLLFAVVNLARKAGVQPGPALDRANRKFQARFAALEQLAVSRGIEVGTAGLAVLDELWDEVKRQPAASAEA